MTHTCTNKGKNKISQNALKNRVKPRSMRRRAGVSVTQSAFRLSVNHPHDISASPEQRRPIPVLTELTLPHSSQTPTVKKKTCTNDVVQEVKETLNTRNTCLCGGFRQRCEIRTQLILRGKQILLPVKKKNGIIELN